ncbi:hypothetical protein VNO80_25000 [Phaseolus coccineus]|uniref:Uncharacterized protein n=1 Tax=Phaseolus coccineus TaxID=3886 RepID=A0AAN9LXR6_PHACN
MRKRGAHDEWKVVENVAFSESGKVNSACKRSSIQSALASLIEAMKASFSSILAEDVAQLACRLEAQLGKGVETNMGGRCRDPIVRVGGGGKLWSSGSEMEGLKSNPLEGEKCCNIENPVDVIGEEHIPIVNKSTGEEEVCTDSIMLGLMVRNEGPAAGVNTIIPPRMRKGLWELGDFSVQPCRKEGDEEGMQRVGLGSFSKEVKDKQEWEGVESEEFSVKDAYACLANHGRGLHQNAFRQFRMKRETRDEEREWVESQGGPAPCDNPSKRCGGPLFFSQSRARGAPWDPPHFSNECVSKSHHVASSQPFFFFVKQNKQDKEYVNLHVPLLPAFPPALLTLRSNF